MINIKRLSAKSDVNTAAWDDFVQTCPTATFFHRAGWQSILQEVFRHDTYFLYAETDGHIEGVLPLAHVNSLLFGNSLVSLPFAVYGGVAASNEIAAQALEQEAQNIAKRLGVAHLELRHVTARHIDWPIQDLYVTFRKEIFPDEDANMLAIQRKQRAMVRKGIKNGLVSPNKVGLSPSPQPTSVWTGPSCTTRSLTTWRAGATCASTSRQRGAKRPKARTA